MHHYLKTDSEVFDKIKAGVKKFEYRRNDRDFSPGDSVTLMRYTPGTADVPADWLTVKIVFVLYGGQYGVPIDYCVFNW